MVRYSHRNCFSFTRYLLLYCNKEAKIVVVTLIASLSKAVQGLPEEFSVSKGDQTKIEFVIELDKDVCLETAQNWFNRACTSYECWRSSPCQHGGSTPSIARSSNSSIFSQSSSGKYSIEVHWANVALATIMDTSSRSDVCCRRPCSGTNSNC